MRKAFRITVSVAALLGLLVAGAVLWLRHQLNGSLPVYDGERVLANLTSPVTVERDALGVVTLRSDNRLDEALAFGFVHAQERFFQMDLMRRSAAGELAALIGPAAIDLDRNRRIHELRDVARRAVRDLAAEERLWLRAYVDGVNAGLAALDALPFEYLILGQTPAPWRPEDSFLVIGAMYLDLQDETADAKLDEIVARYVLPASVADLLYPRRTVWDAPLVGQPGPPASIPTEDVYDLRDLSPEVFDGNRTARVEREAVTPLPGSNNWAVGPERSATNEALLANDPHLGLRVPSLWFRTSIVHDGDRVTGASLPGVPAVVLGSNGNVAWGLTNAYGDWTTVTALEPDPGDASRYLTSNGSAGFETAKATIEVADGEPVEVSYRRTRFGPVIGNLPDGRAFAVRWVGHLSHSYNFAFVELHRTTSLFSAMRVAQSSGIPAQNVALADTDGNIGWTIAGPIPRRTRSDLMSRSDEAEPWSGWLEPSEYPSVINPADSLIWTANGRVVDGPMLVDIGDVDTALGARGTQIRDRLRALSAASIPDMLDIQLDDEARFLRRWREELLNLLADENAPLLAAIRDAVRDWGNRAAPDSVGYRLVRGWRLVMLERMAAALTAEVTAFDPGFAYQNLRAEHWAWPLVEQEPIHLLDPRFPDWRTFKLDALSDFVHDDLGIDSVEALGSRTWGEFNRIQVRHPLSQAVPILSRWLDMPPRSLPGDIQMPRIQTADFGASARFAVSPGREEDGYFHMPGGQSGHPLSPYYGAGHEDWAEGRATPFLPGPAESVLRLVPVGP